VLRNVVLGEDQPSWGPNSVFRYPLRGGTGRLSEQLGALVAVGSHAFRSDDDEVLRALANQVALALKRAELIERLTEENIVRDLFEALAAGDADVAQARARAASWDLTRPHAFVEIRPGARAAGRPWPELSQGVEAFLRRLAPAALCDVGRHGLRAMLPLDGQSGEDQLARVDAALHELAAREAVAVGRSEARTGLADGGDSLREAADAVQIAVALMGDQGRALAYGDLGVYRYLVRLSLADVPNDADCQAIQRLVEYDRRRRTQLVDTLEAWLRDRNSIATTARALYIHPNTLRQRLDRIERLTGLDLSAADLLSLELAIRVVRLRTA
jgi:hypothetical protein